MRDDGRIGKRSFVIGLVGAVIALGGCTTSGASSGKSARHFPGAAATKHPELAFFTTHGNAVYDLGLADDRGHVLRLLTGESKPGTVTPQAFTEISWSPRGRRLAFAGGKGNQTGGLGESTDVFTIRPDASGIRRITHLGDVANPLWSPRRPDRGIHSRARRRSDPGQPVVDEG
jgi:hypothetical protein